MIFRRTLLLVVSLSALLLGYHEIHVSAAELLEISADVEQVLSQRYPRNIDELRLVERQVQRAAAQAMPATVGVRVGQGVGSGVIVSADGLVLTAGHVIGKADRRATLLLPDGRRLYGRTLGANHEIDAGMVQIDDPPSDLPFLPVAKVRPKSGEWVITTGQPGGTYDNRSPPLRLGRVLGSGDDWICTDCTLVGGDSGGPLVNLRGEVIAVHSSIGPSIVHNFHIPVVEIQKSRKRLLAGEVWGRIEEEVVSTVVRPLMGVTGITENGQCVLTEVFRGFPAFEADVRPGDVVRTVDGVDVTSFGELSSKVRRKRPGQSVRLRIERDGKSFEVEVMLAGVRIPERNQEQDPEASEAP